MAILGADVGLYFAGASAIASVSTLGLVLKTADSMRQAARDRTEVIEERNQNLEKQIEATEKWSAREKDELNQKNLELRNALDQALSQSGMTFEALTGGRSLRDATTALQESVDDLVSQMEGIRATEPQADSPAWHFELGRGHMALGEWKLAAFHLDKYCEFEPSDSEAQFARGVAHANCRSGEDGDLSALRAYNEAIAFADDSLDPIMRSRYFGYRGAMNKRLRRLDQAEADLVLALKHSPGYLKADINYNLAGVYALSGRTDELLSTVRLLQGHQRELAGIRFHFNDYFSDYQTNPDFLLELEAAESGHQC